MFYKILVVSFALAPFVLGQNQQAGTCGTMAGIASFNLNQYLGTWYQIERVANTNEFGACSKAVYTLVSSVVQVNNSEVVNETLSYIEGTATAASDNTGSLTVVFPSITGGAATTTTNYIVIATDYTDYALVMSCVDLTASTRAVYGWKLARAQTGYTGANAATTVNNAAATNTFLASVTWTTTDQSEAACRTTSSAVILSGAAWALLMSVFIALYK